jgi:hypothetical protein
LTVKLLVPVLDFFLSFASTGKNKGFDHLGLYAFYATVNNSVLTQLSITVDLHDLAEYPK